MGRIVSRFGSAVIPAIPMPIVVPGVMKIRFPRCWALEKVPIQACWRCLLNWINNRSSRVAVKSLGEVHFTNNSLVDGFDDLPALGGRALLVAHLNYLIVFLLKCYDHFSFPWIVGARLFYIHMFASFKCQPGSWCMPVVRCSIDQYIHFFVIQNLEDILLLLGLVVDPFFKSFGCLWHLGLHRITEV